MRAIGTVCAVLLTIGLVQSAVIKEVSDAKEYAKRSLGVQESSMCQNFIGADYTYICNNQQMCLLCPDKKVGEGSCQVCNGRNECPDGEDEVGCTVRTEPYLNTACPSSFPYSCATVEPSGTTQCLKATQLCDGLWHCSDGSDENGCDYSEAYGTANGQCPVPSQSKIGDNGEAVFDAQMREAHNYFRCLHGVQSMTSTASQKTKATIAVENSAATGTLTHTYHGENLALISMSIADATGFGLTKMWYDEIKDYNYADYTQSTGVVGHFTQVVWAASVNLGCANTVDTNGKTQIACEYDPIGNINTLQHYLDNVKSPI